MLKNKRILVTGATGQVARPIAEYLAADNEVWCIARFTDPALRAEVEGLGIKTWSWTLGQADFTGLPDDFDYVIHAACNIFDVANDYDACITANAEGTGLLMAHVRNCKALLYVSSLQIYSAEADNRRPRLENESRTRRHFSRLRLLQQARLPPPFAGISSCRHEPRLIWDSRWSHA